MDRADALCMDQAMEYAGDGETITWTSDRQGYAVTPEGSFQTTDGRYFREYQATSTIGNASAQPYGSVSRQPSGSWQIVNQSHRDTPGGAPNALEADSKIGSAPWSETS